MHARVQRTGRRGRGHGQGAGRGTAAARRGGAVLNCAHGNGEAMGAGATGTGRAGIYTPPRFPFPLRPLPWGLGTYAHTFMPNPHPSDSVSSVFLPPPATLPPHSATSRPPTVWSWCRSWPSPPACCPTPPAWRASSAPTLWRRRWRPHCCPSRRSIPLVGCEVERGRREGEGGRGGSYIHDWLRRW